MSIDALIDRMVMAGLAATVAGARAGGARARRGGLPPERRLELPPDDRALEDREENVG